MKQLIYQDRTGNILAGAACLMTVICLLIWGYRWYTRVPDCKDVTLSKPGDKCAIRFEVKQ